MRIDIQVHGFELAPALRDPSRRLSHLLGVTSSNE